MPLSQAEAIEWLTERIRQSPVTTRLSENQIVEFVRKADIRLYRQGDIVTRQGEQDNHFFVVISGELQAINERETPRRLLNYHPSGSIVGLGAIIRGDGIRAATLEAEFDSVIAIFTRDDWDWLIRQDSQIEHRVREMERAFNERSITDFPGRQPDEIVLAATKRHVLAFIAKLIWPIVFLIIPVSILLVAELFGWGLTDVITVNSWLFSCLVAPFIIAAFLTTVYFYLDWRNDDLIVTTKRVIHIERILFYSEVRDEVPLTHIQNVTVYSHGWLDALLDIDDIDIQTAGRGEVSVDRIPAAQELLKVILQAQQRAKDRAIASDKEATRRLISERLNRSLLETPPPVATPTDNSEKPLINLPKMPIPTFGFDYFVPRTEQIKTERGEQRVIWRKHYIVLLGHILLPALAVLVSVYLFAASFLGWPPFPPFREAAGPFHWVLGVIALGSLFWYVWEYDTWRRDVYILTNSKIIDIESSAFRLWREKVNEGSFDSIQNITYNLPNILYRLLNLGDVVIQTAGTSGNFTFRQVFNPSAVQEEIFRRWDAYQQRKYEKSRDDTTRQVVTVLGEYHEMTNSTNQS